MVCTDRYHRRCKDCFFPTHQKGEDHDGYPLPKPNKRIIYIDQFSISNMMKFLNPVVKGHERAGDDIFWGTMFERLDVLCKLQLVLCPDSDFHRYESLLAPFYKQLERMYELFSHGVSFYDHETIKLFQIIGQFKIWIGDETKLEMDVHKITHGDINAWQERFMISVGSHDPQALIDELRNNREKSYEYMEGVFKRWQSQKDKDFDYWYNEERKSEAGVIIELHQKDVLNFAKASFGISQVALGDLIPGFGSRLLHSLKDRLKQKGIPEAELNKKVGEFLRSEIFEETPYLKISSLLYAAMAERAAHQERKRPPGRGFLNDVKIISTLLPYCDAMFIDNECRSLLEEKSVRKKFNLETKIFSLSNKEDFLLYLDEIKASMTDEHKKAVEEVYGVNWATPFWEIFKLKTQN